MTYIDEARDTQVANEEPINDREPSAAEIEAWERESVFATEDDQLSPDAFPRLWNLSAGMLMRALLRPVNPEPPQYLTVDLGGHRPRDDESMKRSVAVVKWNMLWEAAQFRRRFFDEDGDLTPDLAVIADRGDLNLILVPRTPTRYYEYAPLYHLLSRSACERFGLPLLVRGQWPFAMEHADLTKYLPPNFSQRLAAAWAWTIWRELDSGSSLSAFSGADPIKLLAHNLDYWLPAVTGVIQQTLSDFPRATGEGELPSEVRLEDGSLLNGAVPCWPLKGGDIWCGEDEARDVVSMVVSEADADGRLRSILDAVRSNRIEDDFSSRWSFAREDFERRLYRKRNKVAVRFVELTDTIPVPGPDAEVEGSLVTADFMALLDEKQRQIVILLSSGYTRLSEIAVAMGYANHSAVSKKLARIRTQAEAFFGLV